jgi:hypothetical protein
MKTSSPALVIAAVVLWGGIAGAGERTLSVASASLAAERRPDGHRTAAYRTEFDFTETDLAALRDDEARVEVSILDRDGHGGRHLLGDNLEDCRTADDGSMRCPGDVLFQRVAGTPSRWHAVIAFRGRSAPDSFRGPVTVRLTYSVSGGPETVQTGNIASCKPAHGGATLTCRAKPARLPG